MVPIRKNYNKCCESIFSSFIENINKKSNYKLRAHNPADGVVLQDRYTFTKNKYRISIVYETKAQALIVTAPEVVMDEIASFLPSEFIDREKSKSEPSSAAPKKKDSGEKQGAKQSPDTQKAGNKGKKEGGEKQGAQKQSPDTQKAGGKGKKEGGEKQGAQNENTFIVKKVSTEKFEELLKKIRANKDMSYKKTHIDGVQRAYTIKTSKEKAVLKYNDDNIELNGIRGDLYSELQLIISQISDYKTVIKTHIKNSGEEKRAKDIERQLKKKLPAAYEFLSEQAKLDLSIGIIDINNSAVVLSDYSMLLIPCFRGLERLIFDLQHAQGIVVKMIGQAYEKEDGKYVLKVGYRKKIPSVIYAEVMASLYTEYFLQRNFYAHSDGGYDNISRIISDKKQVQNIFNNILEVINYNCKKLKEIGFSIK